jgi:hypothetical protein
VEILLAAVILGMLSVPLVGLFQMGNRMGVAGAREFEATLLANEVAELLRAELDERIAGTDRAQNRPRLAVKSPKGFTYGVDVKPLEKGLDHCTITVRWKEGKRSREMSLETLVSRSPSVKIVPTRADGSRKVPVKAAAPAPAAPDPTRRTAGFQLPGAKP